MDPATSGIMSARRSMTFAPGVGEADALTIPCTFS
jgi:hypothetical protein